MGSELYRSTLRAASSSTLATNGGCKCLSERDDLRAEVERLRGRESDALVEMQGLAVQRGISLDAATEEITFLRADLARAQAVVDAARIKHSHAHTCRVYITGPHPSCDCSLRVLYDALAVLDAAKGGR